MATWTELMETSFKALPRQVFLYVGEPSMLVFDKLNETRKGYDYCVRVAHPSHLAYSGTNLGKMMAYLVFDPTEETLETVSKLLKQGCEDSFFIIVPKSSKSAAFEMVKKKAQLSKMYFTVTPPKTEASRAKMVSYYTKRWGVSKEAAFKGCAMLDFCPGRLYTFDQQVLTITQGDLMSSSSSKMLMDSLLGKDSPNTVVDSILSGVEVTNKFSASFVDSVLQLLLDLIQTSQAVAISKMHGNATVQAVVKDTSMSLFKVLQCWGIVDTYTLKALKTKEQHILKCMYNQDNDTLQILSLIWNKA